MWVEMDYDDCFCGLVVIELRVRQDVYSLFMECDGMFGKDVVVEVWVLVGRFWVIFEMVNCYFFFDCFCDNFRGYFQMFFVWNFFIFFDVFFLEEFFFFNDESFDLFFEFVDR